MFVRVTDWALLLLPKYTSPKATLAEDNERVLVGAAGAPVAVPERVIVLGEVAAFVVMVIVPFKLPAVVGENVIVMVHVAAGANVDPQSLVCEKLVLAVMLEILRVSVPVLVRVTV